MGDCLFTLATCAAGEELLRRLRQTGREGRADSAAGGRGAISARSFQELLAAVGGFHRQLRFEEQRLALASDLQLRWMSFCDLPWVARLEEEAYSEATSWTSDQLRKALTMPGVSAIVAEEREAVGARIGVGHVVYSVQRGEVVLLSLAVCPRMRRRKVGTLLLERIKRQVTARRAFALAMIHETNLAAQKFLQAGGFHCQGIAQAEDYLGGQLPEGGDVYKFAYRYEEPT